MAETAPPPAAAATSTPNNGTGTGATGTGTGTGTTGGGAANAPNTAAQGAGSTSGPNNNTTDQNGTNRGLPYYEKLRRDLRDTLQKKRLMDKSMVSCLTSMNKHNVQIELT